MTPGEFIAKWRASELKERSAAQSHFNDLCRLLGVGACEYLDALRDNILVETGFCKRTILLGDFNLEIPPRGYPGKKSVVNQKREATFSGRTMPTAGVWDDPALDKTFKDHIALSPDIRAQPPQFFGRFDIDGSELSDHNGVCIDIELP